MAEKTYKQRMAEFAAKGNKSKGALGNVRGAPAKKPPKKKTNPKAKGKSKPSASYQKEKARIREQTRKRNQRKAR